MPTPVITVDNLSKAYRIGLKEEIPDTITGALMGWAKSPLRNFQRLRKLDTFSHNGESDDILWALKDVTFEVHEGEVIGIIGRNGAGKSTLLKVLSRITEPTSGRATIRGRVSSLLEVGTGFHPEMTGRENVYMNGTILGMRKKEIDRKFDEIVDFSGVEKFLDTPIKRYSSGMKVRLAFAVAAHLEPEILIIDEVLAVGDGEFQKKCLGKMHDVAGQGRTVLFVSHNMPAILDLCSKAIRLSEGRIVDEGMAKVVVLDYEKSLLAAGATQEDSLKNAINVHDGEQFAVEDISVTGQRSLDGHSLSSTSPLEVQIRCTTRVPIPDLLFSFAILNQSGDSCIWERLDGGTFTAERETGAMNLLVHIPPLPLKSGIYSINFMVRTTGSLEKLCHYKEAAHFSIETPPPIGSSKGLLTPHLRWSLRKSPEFVTECRQ